MHVCTYTNFFFFARARVVVGLQLAEELESTVERIRVIEGVVAALPDSEDVARMRAYNWQDVEDLQQVVKHDLKRSCPTI